MNEDKSQPNSTSTEDEADKSDLNQFDEFDKIKLDFQVPQFDESQFDFKFEFQEPQVNASFDMKFDELGFSFDTADTISATTSDATSTHSPSPSAAPPAVPIVAPAPAPTAEHPIEPAPASVATFKTATTRDGATLKYESGRLRPFEIVYNQGRKATFKYDQTEAVTEVVDSAAVNWTRQTNPDERGFALWHSNTGCRAQMSHVVLPDGTYQRTDVFGTMKTFSTDGNVSASRNFSPGFDIKKLLLRIFKLIDKDHDGSLTAAELSIAALRHWNDEDEATLVAMLSVHFPSISAQSASEDPNDEGVTIHDIVRFDKTLRSEQERICQPPASIIETLDELFTKVDTNGDEIISVEELELALRRMPVEDSQREIVRPLAENFRQGSRESSMSIGKNDLLSMYEKVFRQEVARRTASIGWGVKVEAKVAPANQVKLDALRRGTYGDCLFGAALASVVATCPESVERMITDNKNGFLTVKFPGAEEQIIIEYPVDFDFALHAEGQSYGWWPVVLEQAYRIYLQRHEEEKVIFPPINADGMALSCTPLRLMTGKNGCWHYLNEVDDSALAYILSSSPPAPLLCAPLGYGEKAVSGVKLLLNQAYSITAWDPQRNWVRLRNPWGTVPLLAPHQLAPVTADGGISIALSELRSAFNLIYLPSAIS